MYRFWKHLTLPLLDTQKPKVIVEIGSQGGANTRLLCQFCSENKAVLHTIDPKPAFDVPAMEKEFGKCLCVHQDLSLNVLSAINKIDVVLIDGDHNWYTVYNELKMLADSAARDGRAFPVVLLHDICWPYSYRDLYYDPATIPQSFRHEYAQKGLMPDEKGTTEAGLNSHLYNALVEGGPKNGVLTAVEDFLLEIKEPMRFYTIPAFHGYGILISDSRMVVSPDISKALSHLLPSKAFCSFMADLEKDRIKLLASLAQNNHILTNIKAAIAEKELVIAEKDQTIINAKAVIAEKELVIAEKDQTINKAKAVIAEKDRCIAEKDRCIAEKDKCIAEKDKYLAEKNQIIAKKDRVIGHYKEELYSVYTSRSWRYTWPLRRCGKLIRKIFDILHEPRIRKIIKGLYFLIPARIRMSGPVESLKDRFKSKETVHEKLIESENEATEKQDPENKTITTNIQDKKPFLTRAGYCPVCNKQVEFTSKHGWLRDHYRCNKCGSIPRGRILHHALTTYLGDWEKCVVHEGSPDCRHIANKVAKYSASQYFPDKPFGQQFGEFRNENLEQLTFPDNSFDIFITLDVLEHVFCPERAIREMCRVIRPGGVVAFTVPVHKNLEKTRQRASLKPDGSTEHLLEPVYHGNPVGDHRSLVTWDYGQDFPAILQSWTNCKVIHFNQEDKYLGIEGEFLDVFLLQKQGHVVFNSGTNSHERTG